MPFKALLSGNQRKPRSLRYWLIGSAVALALLVGVGSTLLPNLIKPAAASQLVTVPGSVPSVVKNSKNASALSTSQTLSMAISLKLRNKDALASLLQDTKNKKSVNYGKHLTADQVKNSFAPTQETYDAVISYLQSQGFTVTQTYSNRLLISFTGTVAQAEAAFHVQINNYVAPDGKQFYANDSDPTLPPTIASAVESITGLSNYVKFTHPPVKPTQAQNSSNNATANATDCPTTGSEYWLPSQFATAYNYTGLYNKGYKGEGQSVALFELSAYSSSDLQGFINCFDKGTTTNIRTILTSKNAPVNKDAAEVELDADIILGMLPKLNQLSIYEAENTDAGYLGEWARIISDNVPVVSTSWGLCEPYMGSSFMDSENNLFMMAAAQGQTIVAAAGDAGSSDCYHSSNPTTSLSVDDPASQPYITGVGGTLLSINGSSYAGETPWNDNDGAGGGGISSYWTHPAWQTAPGTDASVNRQVPDVALDAAPSKGYLFYCTVIETGCDPRVSNWWIIGGTSAAAPMWAAFVALANEQSVKSGGYNLGFINPYLYQIASDSTKYASDFHDITTGNNDYMHLQSGKYPATTDYDMATGLGSFNAANLANDLIAAANATKGARQAPASKIWYFAEGSVGGGGGFQEFITLQNPNSTTAAQVKITYLFTDRAALAKTYTVNASSRYTVNVNSEVGLPNQNTTQYALSAIVEVTSGPAIVAERPMYFNYRNIIKSGTDVLGASAPGTSYYFPLADTTQNKTTQAWTYISILNPSTTATANVTITYADGNCGGVGQTACRTQVLSVGALKRGTGTPTAVGFATKTAITVTSDQPIVVERPMYVKSNVAASGGWTTGASSEIGATAPTTTAYFAQGNTGKNYQQYFVIANYEDTPANVSLKLTYKTDSGVDPKTISMTVAPHSQYTVNANQANTGQPTDFGTEVTSDQPVVVDREEFFRYGTALQSGLIDVIGTSQSKAVYAFSEGFVSSTFSEYMSVLNPTDADETVIITYFGGGSIFQQQFVIKAHKTILVNVNNAIAPFGTGENSSTIQAMNGTIVVERTMYYGYHDRTGGSDVIGYTGD